MQSSGVVYEHDVSFAKLFEFRFLFCFLSRVTYASSFAINHAVALFAISFAWGKYPSVTAPTFAKSAYTISP